MLPAYKNGPIFDNQMILNIWSYNIIAPDMQAGIEPRSILCLGKIWRKTFPPREDISALDAEISRVSQACQAGEIVAVQTRNHRARQCHRKKRLKELGCDNQVAL